MKRFLLACFLLTATCSVTFNYTATAQITPPPAVTLADFTTKIDQLNSLTLAGNMTAAQAKWLEVHNLMLGVLAVSKYSIYTAPTPTDKAAHESIMVNQRTIYTTIWGLKTDLATNRVALHTQLVAFGATIY